MPAPTEAKIGIASSAISGNAAPRGRRAKATQTVPGIRISFPCIFGSSRPGGRRAICGEIFADNERGTANLCSIWLQVPVDLALDALSVWSAWAADQAPIYRYRRVTGVIALSHRRST